MERVAEDTAKRYGELPEAARNMFDRARIRIRADRLGITGVGYATGKITLAGADVPEAIHKAWRAKGAQVFVKTKKVNYPFRADKEELLPAALAILEELGGADEEE